MTAEQRELYGKPSIPCGHTQQDAGQRAGLGLAAGASSNSPNKCPRQAGERRNGRQEILRFVHEKSDAEQDAMRLQMVGLNSSSSFTTKELPMIELCRHQR